MPTYFYTAITPTGEKVSGAEAAANERQLATLLREKGYVLTTATTEAPGKRVLSLQFFLSKIQRISLVDKLLFTRNLEVMVAAGIPLPKALDVLALQAKSRGFRTVLADIKQRVVEGQSLSAAMAEHPAVFPELFCNMIKVGEESGTLEQVLSQLTLQLERSHELNSRVLGALLYPAVVVVAMVGVGILMLMVVIPQLANVFADLGVPLPFTTRVVIAVGLLFANYSYLVFPAILAFFVLLFQLLKTKTGKRIFDAFALKTPVLGGVVQKLSAALMTRTLSSLLASGVPIVRSLEITSQVVGNTYFQESLASCAQQVGKGRRLSASLKEYEHLYPVVVVQMIEVGEETGETAHILAKLAEFYEEEVGQVTKNLTSIIEPVLMLIIGAMVGLFAISVIQPIYGMLSALQ